MKENMFENLEKRTNVYLLFLNILFFTYYLILSFYSRTHYDDLHFLWMLKNMSVNDFVSDMYFNRSGRFAGYFLYGVIFKIIIYFNEYRFVPILFWFFGATICWYVTKSFLKSISSFLLFNAVALFYNLYVLTNIDFAVFNWLCAICFYMYAPFLILTLYLLNKKRIYWYQWFILILISIFLGGGQEAFTPVVLLVFVFNVFYYLKQFKYKLFDTIKDIRVQKIVAFGFIVLICFIIVVIGPGNYIRMQLSEFVKPTSLSGYISGFSNAISMFLYFVSFYLPYYIILGTVFLYIGLCLPKDSLKINLSYTKIISISILVYCIYFLLSAFPNVYLWSGFGIQRNYTHVVFFTILFICFQAFMYGHFKVKLVRRKLVLFIINFGVAILCLIMIFNLYNDTISAHKYAQSFDNRIVLLEKLNKEGATDIVSVDPISVPYTIDTKFFFYMLIGKKNNLKPLLYYISDTDKEPNEYAYHLQKVFGFNFLIKLK